MSADAPQPWSRRDWVMALLLTAVLLLAYQPAWHGKPIWDDDAHLTMPALCSWAGLGRIWFDLRATQQFYPLTHSAFWLQHWLWGESFLGYHLVNVFLHALSALLLVRIFRRLEMRGAWLAAALWALHPVQVESVAWMTELKNTLSGVCYLGAALVYLGFDRTRFRSTYFLALGLFALSLLAKSVTATLPAALLLVFYWKNGKLLWRKDVRPLIPFFAVGLASGLFTAWVERTFIGAEGGEYGFSLLERCLIAGRDFWFYLGKLAWPADLVFIYPRWDISASVWWQFLFPVLALALVAGLAWKREQWGRAPLVAVFYFAGTLFPALGFVNVYPFRYSFVADHFQYLASIGPVALLVAGIVKTLDFWFKKNSRPGSAFCLALLAALALLTWRQCAMYADIETLWRVTIARNPGCWMAHNNLGIELAPRGRTGEAIAEYREALRLNPAHVEARNNLGKTLAEQGRTDEAILCFREAMQLGLANASTHNNLGNVLFQQGRAEEAISEYREALQINPAHVEARNNLGKALADQGRTDEAIGCLREAMQLGVANASTHNNLGNALLQQGRAEEAIAEYREALRLDPAKGDAHSNLGLSLLRRGQTEEATAHFREALRIQPASLVAHLNLGNALLQQGRTEEAVARFREALRIDPAYAEGHNNLGDALLQQGRTQEAMAEFLEALRAKPDYGEAHYNLANLLFRQERTEDAITHYREALRIKPAYAEAHNNLGLALTQQGRTEEAMSQYREALKSNPAYTDAHYNFGNALLQQGRTEEAIAHYREVLQINPAFVEAHNNLGSALLQQGRVGEAIEEMQKALDLQPANVAIETNLAWMLATAPEVSLRRGAEAVQLAARASESSGGKNPSILRTLAAAYAAAGDFPKAVHAAQDAIGLAEAESNTTLVSKLNRELVLYEAGQAFRAAQ